MAVVSNQLDLDPDFLDPTTQLDSGQIKLNPDLHLCLAVVRQDDENDGLGQHRISKIHNLDVVYSHI